MHGVVSLLDEQHYARVEQLWRELESTFGVRDLYNTPFPHFSYHVAQHYDVEKLERIMHRSGDATVLDTNQWFSSIHGRSSRVVCADCAYERVKHISSNNL